MASSKLNKKLYTDISKLKLLDKDNAEIKFRLKESPFKDDEDEDQSAAQKQDEIIVTGQIFPKSDIFREASYLIEMKLTKTFPIEPPEVRFLTPIYHPNVGKDGKAKFYIGLRNKKIIFRKIF
jgi:ubiquitin-protein ligase